jgi:CHAT domain-containing protein
LSAALLENQSGRYEDAYKSALHAAQLFGRRKNRAGELRSRLEAVYALRSPMQGADCLKEATPLWRQLSPTDYFWLKSQFLLERAQCNNFQGGLSEADHDVSESRNLALLHRFPVLTLRIIGISAGMKHQRGQCDEAWEESEEGLKLYSEGVYPADRLDQFYAVMWQCARDQGHLYTAEVLLRRTIAMREKPDSEIHRNVIREAMLHLHLANILQARNDRSAAAERGIGERVLKPAISETSGKHAKDGPPSYAQEFLLTTYIEPAELLIRQGAPESAVKTLERKDIQGDLNAIQDKFFWLSYHRVLGNAYWEMRSINDAAWHYDSAINLAESSLGGLTKASERLAWLHEAGESYRGKVRVLLEQHRPEDALTLWEWYQSRPLVQGLRAGDIHGTPASGQSRRHPGARFQAPPVLPSAQTRLVYAFFKDGIQIWTVKDASVKSQWVGRLSRDLLHEIRDFTEQCSSPVKAKEDEVKRRGLSLYQSLFAPVAAQLPESGSIVVELDPAIYNFPLEALSGPQGWYLVQKYSFTYSLGMWIDKSLRLSAPFDRRSSLLLLGADKGLAKKDEWDTIKNLFPRTREISSKADLFRLLPQVRVFHFSGHGELDQGGADLLLNDGTRLSARDFGSAHLDHLRLVVLEACSTGLGERYGFLDAQNLVHHFVAAGTPAVIASRWQVDAGPTSQLMKSFYGKLVLNQSVGQALTEAQRELLANHENAHPFYWAGFSATGRP